MRAAVQVKTDPAKDETTRKKTLAELEEMARDLATTMHVQAQKKDDKALYLEAARGLRAVPRAVPPQAVRDDR